MRFTNIACHLLAALAVILFASVAFAANSSHASAGTLGAPYASNPGKSPSPGETSGALNFLGQNTELARSASIPGAHVTERTDNIAKAGATAGLHPKEVDLSAVEKAISGENVPAISDADNRSQQFRPAPLHQFGYSYFQSDAGSFAPQIDIPVGPDYIIGPGDTILLSVWGSLEGSFPLEVNRSGEILLPHVGSLKVWGESFEHLPSLIRNALGKVYRDFDINVTMGKLRIIRVYVVGEVHRPGGYEVSSLATVINALSAAGGPTKNGSLRTIIIRRNGQVVATVDLYDFFLKGDKSHDIRLQSGDTIFVPIIGPTVGVAGNVKRPAIYELKGEKTLSDVLKLSGGLLPTGYLHRVQISRVIAHDRKTVNDFNLNTKDSTLEANSVAAGIPVHDLDLVMIFPIDSTLRGQVRLEGYVLRPGDYALKPGMRISDLLLPDNMLHEYYRDAGEITRLVGPDDHPEKLFFSPAKAIEHDPANDLPLKEFDKVRIFSRWEMEEMPKVRINGEVQKPGEYRYFDNMTVRDLLIMAGNPKLSAYLKNAEISRIRHDRETVTSFPIAVNLEKAMAGDPQANIRLTPFDELTVRKIPNWVEETNRYVTLNGEFVFPGTYPVYKGEHLSSVIERAGGFTDKAYLRGAKFTRISVQKDQQKHMDEVIAKTEQEIQKKQAELSSTAASKEELEATRSALEGLMASLKKLKESKAEGRLVIHLTPLAEFKNKSFDLEVAGGDVLTVPKTPDTVNILGEVYNPTTLVYQEGKSTQYYLRKSGGPNNDADTDDMYIIKADGTVLSKQQTTFGLYWNNDDGGWHLDSFLATALKPGDTLVVPQKLEKTAWMRDIKDITTILSQIALSAGVVVAAGL